MRRTPRGDKLFPSKTKGTLADMSEVEAAQNAIDLIEDTDPLKAWCPHCKKLVGEEHLKPGSVCYI